MDVNSDTMLNGSVHENTIRKRGTVRLSMYNNVYFYFGRNTNERFHQKKVPPFPFSPRRIPLYPPRDEHFYERLNDRRALVHLLGLPVFI
jgi:hypothetical protein